MIRPYTGRWLKTAVLLRLVGVAVLDLRWGIGWLGHAAVGPRCSNEAHAGTLGKPAMDDLRSGEPAIIGNVSVPCRTIRDPSLYSLVDAVSRRCKQTRPILSTCVYDHQGSETCLLTP